MMPANNKAIPLKISPIVPYPDRAFRSQKTFLFLNAGHLMIFIHSSSILINWVASLMGRALLSQERTIHIVISYSDPNIDILSMQRVDWDNE